VHAVPTPKLSLRAWTSPDRKTHSQIDHILMDRRWHSSKFHVQSLRGTNCDIDCSLVIIKVWKIGIKLASSTEDWCGGVLSQEAKWARGLETYQIKIWNRFAALENLNDSEAINMAWENIKENIKTSAKEGLGLYELKQHNPWLSIKIV